MKRPKHRKISTKQPPQPLSLYASFWSRALAFTTDIFMIGLPVSLLMILLFGYDQMHTAGGIDVLSQNTQALKNPPNPIASVTQLLLFMIISVALWHSPFQTPGKKLARIQVVEASTLKRAPYWKLVLRFLGYFISFITLVGFFVGLFRRDNRTLHDLISGTAVIKTL